MILTRILDTKAREVAEAQAARPLVVVATAAEATRPTRGFLRALAAEPDISVIAEVKKASPSKGVIRADFDPVAIAKAYEAAGATCLSVLTDREYFQGDLSYLQAIHDTVSLPLLRKDFIIDPYQVYEARAAGADAILLIVAAFVGDSAQGRTTGDMHHLSELAKAMGMDVLVEVHTAQEVQEALSMGAELIGINNRDLKTFHTSLDVTFSLVPSVPKDRLLVSESGIGSYEDLQRLQRAGVRAVLVGESLMRQHDVGQALQALLGKRGE